MKIFVSYLLGVMFSVGLSVSGMVNPAKIKGFLNLFRDWDPDLVFVMAGAVILNVILFKLITKRQEPVFRTEFLIPTHTHIDWRLVVGSVIFGIGWGLGGICPGPGIANLFTLTIKPFVFVAALLVGIKLFDMVNHKLPK